MLLANITKKLYLKPPTVVIRNGKTYSTFNTCYEILNYN